MADDVHYIKSKLPIVNVSRGQCPHGPEYRLEIILGDKKCWYCNRCMQAMSDWSCMSRDEYYKKYPELKPLPDYTTTKVILDEADKQKK